MPGRIQKPKFDSSSERRGVYEDDQNSLVDNSSQADRTRGVSENAANTLSDIDDLLNDDRSTSGSSADGSGSDQSGAGGGFYSGSGLSDERAGSDSRSLNPSQLGNAEADANPGLTGGDDGGLYKPKPKGSNIVARMTGRQKGIFGTLLFFTVGGGIFGGSFLSGPAMAIHYGQMLANITPFQHQEETSESRLGRMVRAARAGNISEMRLGLLGSKMNAHIQAGFKEQGINFKTDPYTGRFVEIQIDASKQTKYSSLDEKEITKQFAADNGLKEGNVKYNSETKLISADIRGSPLKTKTGLLRTFITEGRYGKKGVFTKMRVTKTALGLPKGWLSPLETIGYAGDEKLANFTTKVAKNSERLKSFKEKSAKVKAFNTELRGKINPSLLKGVAGVAFGTVLVCSAKDIAESIPEANRLNIVYPAVASAADAMATSANMIYDIGTGNNPNLLEDMHVVSESFKGPDGSSPFAGQSNQAIEGKDVSSQAPQDPTISQGFQPTQGANQITQTLADLGDDALCSPLSQITQGVIGVGLLVLGPAGAVTKIIQGATTLATMKLIAAGTDAIKKIVTDEAYMPPAHQGSAGGNVDGLGAIELSNITARANGGTDLNGSELSQLDAQGLNEDFTSQSFASRILNPLDSRSLVAKTIDKQSIGGSQNIANVASFAFNGLSTLGSTLSQVASAFSPKAKAAAYSTPYNLGVHEAGMSVDMTEDPRYDDPFDSADLVGKNILDKELKGDKADGEYAKKAKICFGTTFTKTGEGWDAITTDDVNPYSNEYAQEDCGNKSDEDWSRLRMFVNDSGTMNAYACTELNDGQSCKDLGFDDNSAPAAPTGTTGTPVTPTGTAAELATKIIAVYDAGGIRFEHPADLNDIKLTAAGQAISNENTCEPSVTLDPYLLQTMLSLTEKFNMRVSAIVSGHGACDNYRLHGLGRAFDVGAVTELSTGHSSELDANASNEVDLDFINAAAALLPKGGDVGQVNQPGRKNVTLPPGVNGINDVPNHQHIDVGKPPGN